MEATARTWYLDVMLALNAALQAAGLGERHPVSGLNRTGLQIKAPNTLSTRATRSTPGESGPNPLDA